MLCYSMKCRIIRVTLSEVRKLKITWFILEQCFTDIFVSPRLSWEGNSVLTSIHWCHFNGSTNVAKYRQQKFSVIFTSYSTTFAWYSVSSHRYEAPGDAIEVISPANSPVPAQEKLQPYQQETPKPSQAESKFISICKYSHCHLF